MFKTTIYAFDYDETCKYFSAESSMNLRVVQQKETYANDKLRARGHLFLNELLDLFDLPREKEGQCAGWVWEKYQSDSLVKIGLTERNGKTVLTLMPMEDILEYVWPI